MPSDSRCVKGKEFSFSTIYTINLLDFITARLREEHSFERHRMKDGFMKNMFIYNNTFGTIISLRNM